MRLFPGRRSTLNKYLLVYIAILLTTWFVFYFPSCTQYQFPPGAGAGGGRGISPSEEAWPPPHRQSTEKTAAAAAAAAKGTSLNEKAKRNNKPNDSPLERSRRNFAKYSANAQKIASKLEKFGPDDYLAQNESFFDPANHVVKEFEPSWLIQAASCPSRRGKKKEGDNDGGGGGGGGGDPLSLLVVVPSVDEHGERRKAVRETWASPAYGYPWPGEEKKPRDHRFHDHRRRPSVRVVFLLGLSWYKSIQRQKEVDQSVRREAEKYGDIVKVGVPDRYSHLSLKMVAMLRWADAFCQDARHLIKVDEDTFVNLPLLLKVLDVFSPPSPSSPSSSSSSAGSAFILGHRHNAPKPRVDRAGQWMVTMEEYPLAFFPRYVYSHSYVISGKAIRALSLAAQRMPVVANEDAYVTGILAKTAGVARYHSRSFARVSSVPDMPSLVLGRLVSQTRFDELSQIYHMWEIIKGNA